MYQRKLHKTENRFIRFLNSMSIKRKLALLYIMCVIVPLVLTDGIIASMVIRNSRAEEQKRMQSVAANVIDDFKRSFDAAINISNSIYVNYNIYALLDTDFASNAEFYTRTRQAIDKTSYSSIAPSEIGTIVFCADNDTFVNGGNFQSFSNIYDFNWYKEFENSNVNNTVLFYFSGENEQIPISTHTRKIALVRDLDYYKDSKYDKLLKIDIDYSSFAAKMAAKHYGMLAYICESERIILSTDGQTNYYSPFSYINPSFMENIGYETSIEFLGKNYKILIVRPESNVFVDVITDNFIALALLILFNILLPLVLMRLINSSFTGRLAKLSDAFMDNAENIDLKEIKDIDGTDEIAQVLEGYNGLVRRNRQLIKTIYQDRLTRQEVEIEKQKAELLSMRMQINPHFLFNVLESIRMHSVIKNEKETASMIERLAALEREIVDWKADVIPLSKELSFINNYLKLQSYRYGNRFKFSINAEPEATVAYIPKLTLATFVENSCVHGVEKKSSDAMIFVEASVKNGKLILEVEDTGVGMDAQHAKVLENKMRNCTFAQLQRSDHIGIINACLRTKMIAGEENVRFTFESEKNVGTFTRIEMPLINDPEKITGEDNNG